MRKSTDYNQFSSNRGLKKSKKNQNNNGNSFRKQSFREDSKDLNKKSITSREAENQSFNNSIDVSKTKKVGKMSDRQSIIQSILEESMSEDNGI